MLKPHLMTKLQIVGSKNHMPKVIEALHDAKVIHLVEHIPEEDVDIGEPLKKADILSEILVRVRSVSSYLELNQKDRNKGLKLKENFENLDKVTKEISEKVNDNLEELKIIETTLEKNKVLITQLDEIKALNLGLDVFYPYRSIAYFVGYIKDLEKFETELKKKTDQFELHKTDGKKKLIALFVEKSKEDEVLDLLKDSDFSEFDLSGLSDLNGSIEAVLNKLNNENLKSLKEKKKIEESFAKLKKEWQVYLFCSEDYLEKELEKLEAPLKFAATKNAFMIKGWAPKERFPGLRKNLNDITKENIFIQTEEITKNDSVPVKLNNSKPVEPFEFFMNLYSLPNYKEIDPTSFIFLVFPLLFGFMLGDMGYGVITLIFALILRKKMKSARSFFNIFIYSSLATIFFGALFGEVFGAEVIFGVHLPHIFSRAHAMKPLIAISILIGIGHLLTGFILGFINIYKDHGLKHAIMEKVGWMLLFPGMIKLLMLLGFLSGGPLPSNPVIIGITIVGVIIIVMGEGMQGAVELPGLFSNILSYLRLMAIGLASVMLAIVVNDIAKDLFQGSIIMIIAGVMVLIIGHTINIGIGWLGCFLQTLRLHYVEFFTKFFKGGAQPYKPFGE